MPIASLISLLAGILKLFSNKQSNDRGRTLAKGKASETILKRQDKAKRSYFRINADDELLKRLRKRYKNIK